MSQQNLNISKDDKDLSKEAPHNIDAEKQVLGAILYNNTKLSLVIDFLKQEHFYIGLHQSIYSALCHQIERGYVANVITMLNCFDSDEKQKMKQYLAELLADATVTDIETMGALVYELAIKRTISEIGEKMIHTVQQDNMMGASTMIEMAEQKLFDLAVSGGNNRAAVHIRESLTSFLNEVKNRTGDISGISSGFYDLDKILSGLQKSDLIILAARPSMGKTSLAVTIALNVAKRLDDNNAVAFFSMEMSGEQIAMRLASIESGIDSSILRSGKIGEQDFQKLTQASQSLNDANLFIDDTGALSISAVRARARRLKRKHDIKLIIVDYIQLMRGSHANMDNRVQEIGDITQGLKSIAKELNIPVIALSQLSRAVELRENKRPMLSDLRESGNIEQDADIVIFIYREEYYLARQNPIHENDEDHKDWQLSMDEAKNKAEIIIAKQRNGPVGNVLMTFDQKLTKFNNYSEKDLNAMTR